MRQRLVRRQRSLPRGLDAACGALVFDRLDVGLEQCEFITQRLDFFFDDGVDAGAGIARVPDLVAVWAGFLKGNVVRRRRYDE